MSENRSPRYLPAVVETDEELAAKTVAGARLVGDLAPDVAVAVEMARQSDTLGGLPGTTEQVLAYVLEGDHKYPAIARLALLSFCGGSTRASVEVFQRTPPGWRKAGLVALDLDSWRSLAVELLGVRQDSPDPRVVQ